MRRAWHGFGLEMPWNMEHEHRLQVSGKILPGTPGNMSGHPDTWFPAEDDELDQVTIEVIRGPRRRKVFDSVAFNLMENPAFRHKLEQAVTDLSACAEPEDYA